LLWATYTSADFTGKVVGVADGDTLTVLRGSEQVEVRLVAIDAPEKAQAFGQKSKQALAGLVHGRDVQVVEHGLDKYQRTLGRIYLDGLDVNAEQVRQGMAWVFRRYSKDAGLIQLEAEAREQRRGLWRDSEPVPPWEWRKQKKGS
jgi:endonuclease YncB( thermonuclease family)